MSSPAYTPITPGPNPATTPLSNPARRFSKIRRLRPSYSCESCRQRRVKCDQTHPNCSNCVRNEVDCVYEKTNPKRTDHPVEATSEKSSTKFPGQSAQDNDHCVSCGYPLEYPLDVIENTTWASETNVDRARNPESSQSSQEHSMRQDGIFCNTDLNNDGDMMDKGYEGHHITGRKRHALPVDVPIPKKGKVKLQRPSRHSKGQPEAQNSFLPYLRHRQDCTANADPSNGSGLASPVPSVATNSSSGLVEQFRSDLPTLTEIAFRPQSPHTCAFKAVVQLIPDGSGVSFSRLTQLIESVVNLRNINDFMIKPLQQHSLVVSGVCSPGALFHPPSAELRGQLPNPTERQLDMRILVDEGHL